MLQRERSGGDQMMIREEVEVMNYSDAEIRVYTVDHAFNTEEETNLISVIPFINYHYDKREEFWLRVQQAADSLEKAYCMWDQYIHIEVKFNRKYCNEE